MRELPNTIYMDFPFDDLPPYFRFVEPKSNRHPAFFNTYAYFGDIIPSENPYFAPEERRVSKHICGILAPGSVVDEALVIRDNGTVWKIRMRNFRRIEILDTGMED